MIAIINGVVTVMDDTPMVDTNEYPETFNQVPDCLQAQDRICVLDTSIEFDE